MDVKADNNSAILIHGLDEMDGMIMLVDRAGIIQYVNQTLLKITGYSREEVIGQSPRLFNSSEHDEDFYQSLWQTILQGHTFTSNFHNRRKNGQLFLEHQSITPLRHHSDDITHYISIGRLLTETRDQPCDPDAFIYYDQLTGLPNRHYFNSKLAEAMDHAGRNQRQLAVMLLDLDHFKTINDTLGHHIGDEVLALTAKRLINTVRHSDVCARLGGDEFAILVTDFKDASMLSILASEIVNKISSRLGIHDNVLHVGCSIGIALYPDDAETPEGLLRKADSAMYEAKLHSINHFVFYRSATGDSLYRLQQLENAAATAIENNQLKIVYQPQVDLKSGQCNRVEALLRWEHPELGEVDAGEFVPVLENVGIAREVGHWTIRQVYQQLRDWHQIHGLPVNISVNLSSHQLIQRDFVDYLKEIIGSAEELHTYLNIEITESMLLGDITSAMEKLQDIDEMGINVSLDDFGSGYSSLSQLSAGYVKVLKINRKYIQRIPENKQALTLVNSIIAMAHSLGMLVTAVGVENNDQLQYLKAQGCDLAQGYIFSKPITAEEVTAFLS